MSILSILFVLIIVGTLLWFLNTWVPMTPPFRAGVSIFVVLLLAIWLLNGLGLLDGNLGPHHRFFC